MIKTYFHLFNRCLIAGKRTGNTFRLVFTGVLLLLLTKGVHVRAQVQPHSLTGIIREETNQPVTGASVKIKHGSSGTMSDGNGKFRIMVLPADTLQFSFVGYETIERIAGSQMQLNVNLSPSSSTMNEVVVVGYTSKPISQLSSSVAVISGEKLRDVTSNNLANLIQGKAAGVVVSSASGDPTSTGEVVIRGSNSLSASTSPLVVVDGNIGGTYNPSDVESVTILKDAAATGLYGSRAANGVIIITTKTGKAGETRIDVSSAVGFNTATTGRFHLMNSQQLYAYQQTFYHPDPSVLLNNTDWMDLAFRTGITQNYNIAASGGTDKTRYYIAGNYYKEQGTLQDNGKTTYNFRTNLSTKLNDKLKLSVLFNTVYNANIYQTSGILYDAYLNLPFDPAYDANQQPIDARSYSGWLGRDQENFLQGLQYNFSNDRNLNTSGDLNLDYSIAEHWSFATYNRATLINIRSQSYYDARTKEGGANSGELYNGTEYSSRLLSSNRLKYEQTFGEHHLTALAVAEGERYHDDNSSVSGKGLPAGRAVMSTATDIINNPTGGTEEYNFAKYLVQGDYNYGGKYFLVGSFVHEYSSRFGSSNPGGNFFQAGASWVLSKESFLKDLVSLDLLKIRASYGTTGNAEIGNYAALGLYTIDQSASYGGVPGAYPSQKANPALTWEKIRTTNLGLDVAVFKRLELSIDLYQKNSSALLFKKPLPATSGYSYVFENVGSIRNRGLEFNLTSQNLVGTLKWETNFNIAFNRNKVLSLEAGESVVSPGAAQPVAVGHDMNEWFMPIWAGVNPANGDPQWQTSNGLSNSYTAAAAYKQYTGKSASPKFTGGMTNSFRYKNFSLSAFFNFVYGNYVYNDSRFYFDNDGLYESYNAMVPAKSWTRWEKPGDIATEPKAVLGGNHDSNSQSTRYLENGSYLRLRNATFGYQLPANWIKSLKIANARVFISGDNLLTLTKFSGVDPEVDLSLGTSSFKYPISRKLLFGINAGF